MMTLTTPRFRENNFASDLRSAVLNHKHLDDATRENLNNALSRSMQSNINLLFLSPSMATLDATIAAMFKGEEFKIASKTRTNSIARCGTAKLTLWTCDIGEDSVANHHKRRQIRSLLEETDQDGAPLIDVVIPVFDAEALQLDTSVQMLNEWVLPSLGRNPERRLLVVANQTDRLNPALSQIGSFQQTVSDGELEMDLFAASLRYQLIERFGIDTRLLFCASEPKEGAPFNLLKILTAMVSRLKAEKRPQLMNQSLVHGQSALHFTDRKNIYLHQLENALFETFLPQWQQGGRVGDRLGANLDINGQVVGKLIQSGVNQTLGLSPGLF